MSTKVLQFCLILLLVNVACKDSAPSIEEKIQKVYTAVSVTQDGLTVYTQGGPSNLVPQYSTFKLDLSVPGKAVLKDITAETFTGNYTVTDQVLTLTQLSPEPTGTGGTMSYSITSISEDGKSLVLTTTKGQPKTGHTINVYTLKSNQ